MSDRWIVDLTVEPSDKTTERCLRLTKFFITGRVSEKKVKLFKKLMSTLTKKGWRIENQRVVLD